jgi:hypothetical protein
MTDSPHQGRQRQSSEEKEDGEDEFIFSQDIIPSSQFLLVSQLSNKQVENEEIILIPSTPESECDNDHDKWQNSEQQQQQHQKQEKIKNDDDNDDDNLGALQSQTTQMISSSKRPCIREQHSKYHDDPALLIALDRWVQAMPVNEYQLTITRNHHIIITQPCGIQDEFLKMCVDCHQYSASCENCMARHGSSHGQFYRKPKYGVASSSSSSPSLELDNCPYFQHLCVNDVRAVIQTMTLIPILPLQDRQRDLDYPIRHQHMSLICWKTYIRSTLSSSSLLSEIHHSSPTRRNHLPLDIQQLLASQEFDYTTTTMKSSSLSSSSSGSNCKDHDKHSLCQWIYSICELIKAGYKNLELMMTVNLSKKSLSSSSYRDTSFIRTQHDDQALVLYLTEVIGQVLIIQCVGSGLGSNSSCKSSLSPSLSPYSTPMTQSIRTLQFDISTSLPTI